jgi:hypothetical protein
MIQWLVPPKKLKALVSPAIVDGRLQHVIIRWSIMMDAFELSISSSDMTTA